MDNITADQSIIISLDVDTFMFDKLQQIVEAGFSLVEINSVDQLFLKNAITTFPMLRIGASNIINTQQLDSCNEAKVHFITSPGYLPSIVQTACIYTINYLPGIATLSEALQAHEQGCKQVRPFPANLQFCTLLNKYLPDLKLFPAEIEIDEVEHYLSLPSVSAVSILNPEIKQLQTLRSSVFA